MTTPRSIKILIEPSGLALLNMGDVAMLQAAIQRIKSILPTAEFSVVTTEPDRLRRLCPGCHPVGGREIATWRHLKVLPASYGLFGEAAKERLRSWDEKIRFNFPEIARSLIRFNARAAGHEVSGVDQLWEQVEQCDVMIATGGGYFTDSFLYSAGGVIETMRLAEHHGKPFAFFGHGFGPLTNQHVKKRFRRAIRGAGVIGLREGRKGPEFLSEFDVDSSHVTVTGDDAIELAFSENNPEGNAIGFNVRISDYSGVSLEQIEPLQNALRALASELAAPILSIPIETKREDSDAAAIRKIVPAALLANPDLSPEKPEDVINEIAKCRVVITGSYHAGVFALSRGIPVVALVGSDYYADKFFGLQAQFGNGVDVVKLTEPDAMISLQKSVKNLWQNAEGLRQPLLESAKIQINKGKRLYQDFFVRFK